MLNKAQQQVVRICRAAHHGGYMVALEDVDRLFLGYELYGGEPSSVVHLKMIADAGSSALGKIGYMHELAREVGKSIAEEQVASLPAELRQAVQPLIELMCAIWAGELIKSAVVAEELPARTLTAYREALAQ